MGKKEGKSFLLFACSVCSTLFNCLCFHNSALTGLSVFLLTTLFSCVSDSFSGFSHVIFRTAQAKMFLKLFTKTSKILLPTSSVFLSASHLFLTSSHQPSMEQQLLSLNSDICLCFSIIFIFLSQA